MVFHFRHPQLGRADEFNSAAFASHVITYLGFVSSLAVGCLMLEYSAIKERAIKLRGSSEREGQRRGTKNDKVI